MPKNLGLKNESLGKIWKIKEDELTNVAKKNPFKKLKIPKDLQIKIEVQISRSLKNFPFDSNKIPIDQKLKIKNKI